jgi:hypothetical protein
MLGWVETHMGPGANERSNGFFAFGLLGVVAARLIAGAALFVAARASPLAIALTPTFASPLTARPAIATPLARSIAVAWRRAVWSTAFEPWRWSWRAPRRMGQTFLDELGHLFEFFSA